MSQVEQSSATAERVAAAEAYVKALRTGEGSAVVRLSPLLAPDVVLRGGQDEVRGHDPVLARVTGQWPLTPVLVHGGWSSPRVEGERVLVSAEFTAIGAAPTRIDLAFSFNAAGQIASIEQKSVAQTPVAVADGLPEFVRGLVNGALANGTPMCVAYTDADGQPVQSLRGSTQVYSPTQLCMWVRNAEGGLVRAMQGVNRRLSLLYRDSKSRTTLIFQGLGHVEGDPAVRARVYDLAPEVEQNHDPARRGAALLIDIQQLQGTTVRGPVRFATSR